MNAVPEPSPPVMSQPVVRDKRRIDPETGSVRPEATSGGTGAPPSAERDAEVAALAERTADLQRLQAEYANYRKRVERDREAVRELAVISVLSVLLPVLDDIDRAREHGELVGGFKVVAESLEATLNKLGLQAFGTNGDPFDPTIHEALMHEFSAEVAEPTCVAVLQPGYRVGERVVRPARVRVAEPQPEPQPGPQPAPQPEPEPPGGSSPAAAAESDEESR